MPDDGKPGPAGPMHTRKLILPPRPPKPEETRYFSGDGVADLTLARVKSARLSEDELRSLQGKGEAKIPQVKNILRGAKEEENRLSRHAKDDEGKIIDVDRVRDTLISVTEYVSSAKFKHPEGGEGQFHLSVFMLYCGHPVNRRFLLSNAPLSILGMLEKASEIETKFFNCITGRCSITLGGEPGTPRYIYLATKDVEDVMAAICSKYPATDSVLTSVEELKQTSKSDMDLPVAVDKPEKDPFNFSPRKPSLRVRKEDSAPRLMNTLGIRPEDLRKANKADNPRAKELFGGYEVVLTQPGVEGMRLIVTPQHPSSLVDLGAEQIGYIDPSKFMEVNTRKGNKVFYILVKPKIGRSTGFSLERLDDSCQILGGDEDVSSEKKPELPKEELKPAAEAPPKVIEEPAPALSQDPAPVYLTEPEPAVVVIKERVTAREIIPEEPSRPPSIPPSAMKLLDDVYAAVREHGKAMGQAEGEAADEVMFGDSIAVLIRSGSRHYLITDGDWNEARVSMEKHLSAPGKKAMLTEIISGFGKKYVRLESGDRITITTRSVGKSIRVVYGGEVGRGHSDTLEMIPPDVLARAGVLPSKEPAPPAQEKEPEAQAEAHQVPEDPAMKRRKELTTNLLKSANLYIPEAYFLEEESESMIGAKAALITGMPERMASAQAVEAFGGWYISIRTTQGEEYSLFRFPSAPSGINENLLSMPAATIFTCRLQEGIQQEFSYILMEKKFLTLSLTEIMLRRWAKE